MSKWQKITEASLTVPEQQYFRAKAKDGMCDTKNRHYCFVGKCLGPFTLLGCLTKTLKMHSKSEIVHFCSIRVFQYVNSYIINENPYDIKSFTICK